MTRCTRVAVWGILAGLVPAPALAGPLAVDAERPPAVDRAVVAERPSSPRVNRAWALDFNVGVGAPAGPLSLSRDLRFHDRVGARVSLGIGNLTVMPYLVRSLGVGTELRLAAGASAGLSVWRERNGLCFDDECALKRSWTTVFGNAELTVVRELSAHTHIRPYLGYAAALNPDGLACTGGDEAVAHCEAEHADDGGRRIYGGLALGFSW